MDSSFSTPHIYNHPIPLDDTHINLRTFNNRLLPSFESIMPSPNMFPSRIPLPKPKPKPHRAEIFKESQLINILDLPAEIRLRIVRFIVPKEYRIEIWAWREWGPDRGWSPGLTRNPAPPLLLVNHAIASDTLSVSSIGTISANNFSDACYWWDKATDTKRKNVGRVVIRVFGITTEHNLMERLCLGATETYEYFSRRYHSCVVEKQGVRIRTNRVIYYDFWVRVEGPRQELREVEGEAGIHFQLGKTVNSEDGSGN